MILTTGAILRRITEAELSAASHKLATIIAQTKQTQEIHDLRNPTLYGR